MQPPTQSPNLHALILCGGTSRRMGRDKATLDFAGEPMLARVVRRLSAAIPVENILCVAAKGQTLPPLPAQVRVVFDRQEDCGPLEGLATGLSALADADAVFVTTCDAPLVVPELPAFLARQLKNHDAVVPKIDGQLYPLTAVYSPRVAILADSRLARGERRVIDWVAELDIRYLSREELVSVDPELVSMRNCNTPEEYEGLLEVDHAVGPETTATPADEILSDADITAYAMAALRSALVRKHKNIDLRIGLCALEPTRVVFRVFLSVPHLAPSPYVVYAVDRSSHEISPLKGGDVKPYFLPHYK